jgi:N6-adenosine-specific RNA methylase IME4
MTGTTVMAPWADRITAAWNKSRDGVMEVGRLLAEAKAALPHGEWIKMIENDLPFGAKTAQRLKTVAEDPKLSNGAHAHHLPGSWYTLYELTKLDDTEFAAGVDRGIIRPDMERKDLTPLLRDRRLARNTASAPVTPDTCEAGDLHRLIEMGAKFGTIYADPPWLYDNQGTRAATGNHYGGLTVDELCALPVKALAADSAHLHLWTTNAFLFECPRIFAAWGFEFRSSFVWCKPEMGIGNYWRNSHEFLLTAIRGDAKSFADKSLMSWLECSRGRHSAKPEQVRGFIEKASPGPRIEMFARSPADGWAVWGNQIERGLLHQSVERIAVA